MKKFIGWTFILAGPFTGPLAILLLLWDASGMTSAAYCVAWVLLFCLWFDDSEYQKLL